MGLDSLTWVVLKKIMPKTLPVVGVLLPIQGMSARSELKYGCPRRKVQQSDV